MHIKAPVSHSRGFFSRLFVTGAREERDLFILQKSPQSTEEIDYSAFTHLGRYERPKVSAQCDTGTASCSSATVEPKVAWHYGVA